MGAYCYNHEYCFALFCFFKKHIGGEATDFWPKAGRCAFSCNHP